MTHNIMKSALLHSYAHLPAQLCLPVDCCGTRSVHALGGCGLSTTRRYKIGSNQIFIPGPFFKEDIQYMELPVRHRTHTMHATPQRFHHVMAGLPHALLTKWATPFDHETAKLRSFREYRGFRVVAGTLETSWFTAAALAAVVLLRLLFK